MAFLVTPSTCPILQELLFFCLRDHGRSLQQASHAHIPGEAAPTRDYAQTNGSAFSPNIKGLWFRLAGSKTELWSSIFIFSFPGPVGLSSVCPPPRRAGSAVTSHMHAHACRQCVWGDAPGGHVTTKQGKTGPQASMNVCLVWIFSAPLEMQ